jgi:thioredoxin
MIFQFSDHPMAAQNIVTLTDSNFDSEVLNWPQPVLVDFWATWCGPCKMIAPIIDEIASERAGVAKIAKVDVDQNPGLSARFGIKAIPTLLFFKNGQVQTQIMGASSKRDLLAKLDALV